MMMQALLLVCALSSADCTETTALKVVRGPVVSSEALCGFQADVLRAQNSGEDMRVTTRCELTSHIVTQTAEQSPIAAANVLALLN